jgi:hypothetical protein
MPFAILTLPLIAGELCDRRLPSVAGATYLALLRRPTFRTCGGAIALTAISSSIRGIVHAAMSSMSVGVAFTLGYQSGQIEPASVRDAPTEE